MTVYIDIVFLENLCINCIILLATGLINKTKINILRILLSSLLGSVYAVLSYTSLLNIFSNIVMKITLSICMVYIAYNPRSIKQLFKQLIIFYLTSFTFGGVAFALLYFVKPQNILIRNGVLIGTYPIKIALLGVIIGFVIITIAFKNFKGKFSKKDMFCNLQLNFKERKININAMIDTGNLLKEPITGKSVVVVEKEELYELLPKSILDESENIISGKNEMENIEYAEKLKLIPFTSLGRENGLLLGFKIDSIIVEYDDNLKQVNDVIVGIYDKVLSKSKTYTSLIGLDLIEAKESEYIKTT